MPIHKKDMFVCPWALGDPLLRAYHDAEWGVPCHDDRALFELLCLEGAQAGLSWLTILRRRDGYRNAFHHFSIDACAALTDDELEDIRLHGPVIRNRLKIASVRRNSRVVQAIQDEYGSFDAYVWHFTDGRQIRNAWKRQEDMPAQSELSERISKDLKRRGASFVGPVIIYSFLQAAGVLNDHLESCPWGDRCSIKE